MIPLAVVVFALLGKSLGQCPHNEPGLDRWSDASTWAGATKPVALESVTIDRPVLLDESPPPLTKIYIADTGKLVVSPDDGPLLLKLRHILIHGELHIGSEDCPFTEKFKIVLTGQRNDNNGQYKVQGFGEKFIGVENQGVLQIHGERKLSWTKLEGTVSPPSYLLDALAAGQDDKTRWSMGLSMYVANVNADGTPVAVSHETHILQDEANPTWVWWDRQQMIQRLQGLQDGNIVMIAVQRGFEAEDHGELLDALETAMFGSVTGTLELRNIHNDAFAMIFKKGDQSLYAHATNEIMEVNMKYARANLQVGNIRFSAKSLLHNFDSWFFHVNFLAIDADKGMPIVTLVDDATSWHTGDLVVFTSTDFDMHQAEVVKIADCQRPTECTNKQIKLENELSHTHFGMILNNVDMRGEVALLTRNIVLEAETQPVCPQQNGNCDQTGNLDTFGGHVKVNLNFKSVNIEGAELHNMGQQTDLGSYPLHFHMCNGTKDRAPYLRSNSIQHAFTRFITIHGTHDVRVEDNVGFETFGHGYFLEDGGEKHTVFDGNLGANVRRGGFLTTDHTEPTVFWITNPLVTFENNVAAGTEGTGIWYVFPWEPVGPSNSWDFMARGEAMHTPLTKFHNNVAHSSAITGFNVEGILLDDDGNVEGHIAYEPLENPLDPGSAHVTVNLTKYTGYRNYHHNAWIRGSQFRAEHFSLSDAGSGLTMPSLDTGGTTHMLINSVIVGRSANPTVPYVQTSNWPGSNINRLFGIRFYFGNTYVNGVWFGGFQETSGTDSKQERAGAISWEPNAPAKDVNAMMNLKFDFEDPIENRVWTWKPMEVGLDDKHSERVQTVRDLDGSITGISGATVIRPQEFYVTDSCEYRENWRMAVCPFLYARIWINSGPYDIYRSDKPAFPERADNKFKTFSAALQYDFYYTIQWVNQVPPAIDLFSQSISDGNGLVIGVCLPQDATFVVQSAYPVLGSSQFGGWRAVNSIQEVKDNEGTYYHNTQTRALYVRLFNNAARDVFDFDKCPGDQEDLWKCPSVRIVVTSSDYSDTKCNEPSWVPFDGANRALGGPYEAQGLQISTRNLPLSSLPADWGAGSTKPFVRGAEPVDGQFSEWSEWTDCSAECGGGTRTRDRACDSPPPSNGGQDCVGATTQSEDCNIEQCVLRSTSGTDKILAVNGKFSKWSKWSECQCYPGSQGFKTQTKECNNPAPKYGGKHCKGTALKVASCNAKNCNT